MPDEGADEAAASAAPVAKHDDLIGEEVPPELAFRVRAICRDATSLTRTTALVVPQESVDFPGAQPVSLSRANAHLLADPSLDYRVSWKADGTRYLMLLLHGGAYLLDRAGRVRRCQMRFPMAGHEKGKPYRPLRTHDYTLLDGEMVVDAAPGLQPQRRFLVYDICSVGASGPTPAQPLCDRSFRERYSIIERAVIAPKKAYEAAARDRYSTAAEPFRVRRKDFYEPARAAWLLETWMPTLTHPSDGLIFQPGSEAYRARTHEHLLKWKFPELNTVDFLVYQSDEGTLMLALTGEAGRLKALQDVVLPPELAGDPSPLAPVVLLDAAEPGEAASAGQIAECRWDGARGAWSLLRVRRDKDHPNHESVFLKVWQSIRDDMRAPEVLQLLDQAAAARAQPAAAAAHTSKAAGAAV